MVVLPATAPAISSSARQIWRFGLLCGAFALLWAVGSAYGLGENSRLDEILCHQLAAASAWGLRAMGWAASVDATRTSLLLLDGQPSVIVGAPCDGLVLYALLAGFVLAYPGPPRRRLWFIPLGIGILWLLNIVRIMVLALNHQYSPETFEFDHHYAFNAVAYSVLAGLWLLWTRQAQPREVPLATQPANTAAPAPTWLTTRSVSGLLLLALLVLASIFRTQIIEVLGAGWVALLAGGPAWLHRLPGVAAGDVPAGVSRLALPVGLAYLGLFLLLALSVMYLLLARSWRLVWRAYAGMLLAYLLLLAVGRLGGGPAVYRLSRMLLDFVASLLPVAGLLVLLWRPAAAPGTAPAELQALL